MNLEKFKSKYHIVTQELVFEYFEINLLDDVSEDSEFHEAIDRYIPENDTVATDGMTTYFIYNNDTKEEVFSTDVEQELFDKVKKLSK